MNNAEINKFYQAFDRPLISTDELAALLGMQADKLTADMEHAATELRQGNDPDTLASKLLACRMCLGAEVTFSLGSVIQTLDTAGVTPTPPKNSEPKPWPRPMKTGIKIGADMHATLDAIEQTWLVLERQLAKLLALNTQADSLARSSDPIQAAEYDLFLEAFPDLATTAMVTLDNDSRFAWAVKRMREAMEEKNRSRTQVQ